MDDNYCVNILWEPCIGSAPLGFVSTLFITLEFFRCFLKCFIYLTVTTSNQSFTGCDTGSHQFFRGTWRKLAKFPRCLKEILPDDTTERVSPIVDNVGIYEVESGESDAETWLHVTKGAQRSSYTERLNFSKYPLVAANNLLLLFWQNLKPIP